MILLRNCIDSEDTLIIDLGEDTFGYSGRVLLLEEYPNICWEVVEETENTGEAVTIEDVYFTCEDCARTAYQLTDCTGRLQPKYSEQDFESLVGSIIKVPFYNNACFTVSVVRYSQDYTYENIEYSNIYEDCNSCRQLKTITPNETSIRCDENLLKKVASNFSESMHQEVMSKRYGVEFCCLTDKNKWWLKQKMLEFDLSFVDSPEFPEPFVEVCCIQVDEPCVLPQNNCNTCDPIPNTPLPLDCNCTASVDSPHDCHTYTVEVTQIMIDDATGNTNTKANNKVYFGYIPCGETLAVTVPFTDESTSSYCVLGIPILGYFKDNEWVDIELVRGEICETE
jgi:hypothetical protein